MSAHVVQEDWCLCQCSGMSPDVRTSEGTRPPVRDVWFAFVVAGVRSKFGATVLVLMGGAAAWEFVSGNTTTGLIILGIALLTYARLTALIAASIVARQEKRNRSKSVRRE
jgi:hypothetical protein